MNVQTFTGSLESKDLDKEKQVVIKSYAAIYSSIKKTEEYHIYVTFLVVFLCIFGLRFASDINLIEAQDNSTENTVSCERDCRVCTRHCYLCRSINEH